MIFHGDLVPWDVITRADIPAHHEEGKHAYTTYPWGMMYKDPKEVAEYLNAIPQPGLFSGADALFPRFAVDPYYMRDKPVLIRITLPEGTLTQQENPDPVG